MLFKRNYPMKDERLEKEQAKLTAPTFFITEAEILVLFIVKLMNGKAFWLYALELLCLALGFGYVFAAMLYKGTLFVKHKDAAIKDINRAILSKAAILLFWLLIFGEFILIFSVGKESPENLFWAALYIPVWFFPALYITVLSIKKGLMVWGSKKNKAKGKKSFAKSTAIGALFYGLIMGFPKLYHDGAFHAEGIIFIIGMAVGWGILFYLGMLGIIRWSEKRADKNLAEEVQGENREE